MNRHKQSIRNTVASIIALGTGLASSGTLAAVPDQPEN